MDSIQSNKLGMYMATSSQLTKSPEIIRNLPPLPENATKLNQKISDIKAAAALQAVPTSGTVVDRDAALDAAAYEALSLAGKVLSFASKNQLGELAAKVRLSYTDFRGGRNLECVQLAQSVHDAAQPVVSDLSGFGVTPETLDALNGKIATATMTLTGPRGAVTARKSATARLKTLFRETDALLENEIDPLVVPLMKTNPAWYQKYRAARTIIDLPGGRPGNGTPAVPATPATPAKPAK